MKGLNLHVISTVHMYIVMMFAQKQSNFWSNIILDIGTPSQYRVY